MAIFIMVEKIQALQINNLYQNKSMNKIIKEILTKKESRNGLQLAALVAILMEAGLPWGGR